MGIRMRAKIAIAFLSISLIASFGLTSNQAFAGIIFPPTSCEDCDALDDAFSSQCTNSITSSQVVIDNCIDLARAIETCRPTFCPAVGGDMIQMETTSILVAGAQYNAAWMIPIIVSAIGIGIVIARKF